MKRVFLASPFAGSFWQRYLNRGFARRCLKDSLARGEAPFAPHLLYPQALNDSADDERDRGILAGQSWLVTAEAIVVYVDRGISAGMMGDIDAAELHGMPVEYRGLSPEHQLQPGPAVGPDPF
jgi:hypothetical protein